MVRNITDVDDSILGKARELGVYYLDLAATEATAEVVRHIPGLRPLDAVELSNAAPIEAFAAVLLQLNARYRTRVAIKLTGIDDAG